MPRRGVPHRRKLADPLVPISGGRVRALLREAKLSERAAVRALRRRGILLGQGTLDHILQGRQSRCRASLRDGLASHLGVPVPPEWLGGQTDDVLWGAARDGRDLNLRPERSTPLGRASQRAREHYGVPVTPGIDVGASGPPLYELVAYRLFQDVDIALQRSPGGEFDQLRTVRRLLSLTWWRRWVLPDKAGGIIEPEEMAQFAAAIGHALRVLLRPWLEGDSSIREDRLQEIQAALSGIQRAVEYTAMADSPGIPRTGAGPGPGKVMLSEGAIRGGKVQREVIGEEECEAGEPARRAHESLRPASHVAHLPNHLPERASLEPESSRQLKKGSEGRPR